MITRKSQKTHGSHLALEDVLKGMASVSNIVLPHPNPPLVRLSITRIFLHIRESDRSQTPKP